MRESRERRKLLVVDDEVNIRELFAEYLSRRYDVKTAENGMAALSIVQKDGLALVISDIDMPVMDGITFIRKMTEMKRATPILLVTGGVYYEEDMGKLGYYGAIKLLRKPVSFEMLDENVDKMLILD